MSAFDWRVTPARPDLAAESLRGVVEAAAYAEGVPARVIASSAPLWREPRPDAPLLTEALRGELVTVYEQHDGFAWVQLRADGYVGYMPDALLGPVAPAPTHRVAVLRTFAYSGASIKLPPRAALSFLAEIGRAHV
jgi:hypothetical protein